MDFLQWLLSLLKVNNSPSNDINSYLTNAAATGPSGRHPVGSGNLLDQLKNSIPGHPYNKGFGGVTPTPTGNLSSSSSPSPSPNLTTNPLTNISLPLYSPPSPSPSPISMGPTVPPNNLMPSPSAGPGSEPSPTAASPSVSPTAPPSPMASPSAIGTADPENIMHNYYYPPPPIDTSLNNASVRSGTSPYYLNNPSPYSGFSEMQKGASLLNQGANNMQANAQPFDLSAITDPVQSALSWMREGRDQGGYLTSLLKTPESTVKEDHSGVLNNLLSSLGPPTGGMQATDPRAKDLIANNAGDSTMGLYPGNPNDISSLVKDPHPVYTPPPTNEATGNGMPTPLPNNATPAPQFGANGQGVLADALNQWGFGNPATPVAQPASPVQDIYDLYKQLLSNVNAGQPQLQSEDAIRALAQKQINAQYDPQIALIQQQIDERNARYGENEEEARQLWQSLVDEYNAQRDLSNQSYDSALGEQASRAANVEDFMNSNYGQATDYMNSNFDKLGIGDTSAYTDSLLSNDLSDINAANSRDNNAYSEFLSQNEVAGGDYLKAMANSALMHGAETRTDLLSELNNYLDTANIEMSGLKSQKSAGLQSLVAQMMLDQQNQQNDSAQQTFNNLLNAGQFRISLENLVQSMNKQTNQQNPKTYTSGILGAMQQFAGNPHSAQLSDLFKQLTTNPQFVENRFETPSGDIVKMTPGQLAQTALQLAQQNNLSPEDTQALWNAVYAYYGQLGK